MRLCANCGESFSRERRACPFCSHEIRTLDGHLAFAPELAENNSGFEADYFPALAKLEPNNFWFRSRNQLIVWALRRYFPRAQSLLEIGCGTGFVLSGIREALPGLSLAGSEVLSAGLGFAAQRLPGADLFQMDARRIPFTEEFDVIGAFDVLEHVKEDSEVLAQMYQATRRQGGILVTVPHHPFLWSPADDYARHVRRYTSRELNDRVKRAGFDVIRITSFVSLLLPLLVLSRFKQRFQGNEFDPTSELRINSVMNTGLQGILDLERTLIRGGLSFPVGGSLLLIARRS
jgi:SAM-dependent methyltransferase